MREAYIKMDLFLRLLQIALTFTLICQSKQTTQTITPSITPSASPNTPLKAVIRRSILQAVSTGLNHTKLSASQTGSFP
ncbi:hypothetical protein ACROYT_G038614 [Oculina patagonica]